MAADRLRSAIATGLKTVKVVFGDASAEADTSETATPVEVSRWSLNPDLDGETPAYTPTVVSVEPDDESSVGSVVLTTDQELTPGVVYAAKCVGVTGIADDDVHNVAGLIGFPLSPPAARKFDLRDLLPSLNLAEDTSEELEKFVACLQEPTSLLWNDVDKWVEILDCDLAPEQFLDRILADFANPFQFSEPLSVNDKRKLCRILVQLYQLKGTTPGAQAAIQFFLGLKSEFFEFDGLGSTLGDATHDADQLGDVAHGDATAATVPGPGVQFYLGGGGPFRMIAKLGTVVDPEISGSGAGTYATAKQVDRATKIIRIMKPVGITLESTGPGLVRSGCTVSVRNSINRVDASHVDLIMENIADSDARVFLERNAPGVNEFNTHLQVAAGAGTATKLNYAPGGTRYWNGVGKNTTVSPNTIGLLSNEITNSLAKPVLTATAMARKVRLTWAAVTGATLYRIYKSTGSFASPTVADNAGFPIEVSGDLLTYDDQQESGTTMYYRVTPVKADAEGFFSAQQSATAL